MKPKTFRKVMGRLPQRQQPFHVPIAKGAQGKGLDPGALFHYWHPDREGVEACPPEFARALAAVSMDLRCVRPPAGAPIRSRCWLVWTRKPEVTHWLSPGWLLINAWHTPNQAQTPLPLDNRLLANLHLQSIRGGREFFGRDFRSPVEYFDTIMKQGMKEQQARDDWHQDDLGRRSKDYHDFKQIKNIGPGNKFALHHDGTLLPSKGEAAWSRERADQMLPDAIVKQRREELRIPRGARALDLSAAIARGVEHQANRDFQDALLRMKIRSEVKELVAKKLRSTVAISR